MNRVKWLFLDTVKTECFALKRVKKCKFASLCKAPGEKRLSERCGKQSSGICTTYFSPCAVGHLLCLSSDPKWRVLPAVLIPYSLPLSSVY